MAASASADDAGDSAAESHPTMVSERIYQQLTQSESTELYAQLRDATTLQDARHLASRLLEEHPALSFEITLTQPHWRVRPCSSQEGFKSVSEVLAPPSDQAKPGRTNHKEDPKLYISTRLDTALAEVEAKQGSHYHAIALMSKNDAAVRLALVGEHHHVLRKGFLESFGYDPSETIKNGLRIHGPVGADRIAFADALMADILSDPNARAKQYIPSRGLADAILLHAGQADGIVFPSVRHEHGRNYCIDPTVAISSLKIVASTVVRVDRAWRKGYFSLSATAGYMLEGDSATFRRIDTKLCNSMFNLTPDEVKRFDLDHWFEV